MILLINNSSMETISAAVPNPGAMESWLRQSE